MTEEKEPLPFCPFTKTKCRKDCIFLTYIPEHKTQTCLIREWLNYHQHA